MANSTISSTDAALRQAIANHRAGDLIAAETAYLALLGDQPDHAQAHHNLGVLMMQAGRISDGLRHLKAAVNSGALECLYYFSYAKALLVAGNPQEALHVLDLGIQRGLADKKFDALRAQIQTQCSAAETARETRTAAAAWREALAANPDDPRLLDCLGSALLAQGEVENAIDCFRKAVAVAPDFADAHYHLGSVLSENGRVAEGFEHFMRRAALVYGMGRRPASDNPDPPHKVKHDLQQRDYLAGGKVHADAPQVPDIFHLADGSRVDGLAINPAKPGLLQEWLSASPQMVLIEDFLTVAALAKLRAYCAGSTIWRKLYDAGYLGAAPEDGFSCPLLAQIVEEIQATFQPILAGEPFRYLGAFKYDSDLCAGTNTHADNSIINVNFYIAPDDANLDPERGGMEIWDIAAPSFEEMRKYNGNEAAVRAFLGRSGARVTIIPHRANRAVIFKSTLFHKTDKFTFKSDYLSRRINVSLLFGTFGGV